MLINCVAYQDGHKLTDITPGEISQYVSRPECFIWVALKDPDPGELAQMQQQFGLHELAIEDARHGHQRPKIDEYGDSLFVVLHTLAFDEQEELRVGEVNVFVGKNYVLTTRSGSKEGFTELRSRCEREPHLLEQGSAYVLYALMDVIVDRYFPLVETLDDELEIIEDQIFTKLNLPQARVLIEDLYRFKRRLVMLNNHIAPLLDPLSKLVGGGRVPQLCNGMEHYFRDVYDHLQRITKTLDSRREMAITAIQVNLGMISLAEGEVTKRLGAFAALFAVPTMIAGIYGMNFQHIPELNWVHGYPLCLSAMLIADFLLWWRFKKSGWL